MTQINPAAKAAQDAARHQDGKFGPQVREDNDDVALEVSSTVSDLLDSPQAEFQVHGTDRGQEGAGTVVFWRNGAGLPEALSQQQFYLDDDASEELIEANSTYIDAVYGGDMFFHPGNRPYAQFAREVPDGAGVDQVLESLAADEQIARFRRDAGRLEVVPLTPDGKITGAGAHTGTDDGEWTVVLSSEDGSERVVLPFHWGLGAEGVAPPVGRVARYWNDQVLTLTDANWNFEQYREITHGSYGERERNGLTEDQQRAEFQQEAEAANAFFDFTSKTRAQQCPR